MLAVQAGNFKAVGRVTSAFLNDIKRMDKLSTDFLLDTIPQVLPHVTSDILVKIQRAKYNGNKDEKVLNKIWLLISVSTEDEALVTRDKALLVRLVKHKRTLFQKPPLLILQDDFTINFPKHGIYTLIDEYEHEVGLLIYRKIVHNPTGIQVSRD